MVRKGAGKNSKSKNKVYSLEEDVNFILQNGEMVLRAIFGGTLTNNKIASELDRPESIISGYCNRLTVIGLICQVTNPEDIKQLLHSYKHRVRSVFKPYQLTAAGKNVLKVFDSYTGDDRTPRIANIIRLSHMEVIESKEREKIEKLVKEIEFYTNDYIRIIAPLEILVKTVDRENEKGKYYWASLESVTKICDELLDHTHGHSQMWGLRLIRAYVIASNCGRTWEYKTNNNFQYIKNIILEQNNENAFEACLTLVVYRNPDTSVADELLKIVLEIIWTIFQKDYIGSLTSTDVEIEMLKGLWNDLSVDQKKQLYRTEKYLNAPTFDDYYKAITGNSSLIFNSQRIDNERTRPLRYFLLGRMTSE